MNNKILAASQILAKGGVVGLPTETVYGLAANALNPEAVQKIFDIKGRPLSDPLIVHVLDESWLEKYSELDTISLQRAEKIIDTFWPGPITLIIRKRKIIPDIVTAGLSSVAIRSPNHPIFQEILRLVNFPLAAPSANPFGYISPTSHEQVRQTLGDKVDMILEGGNCDVGIESTILDLTKRHPKIVRPGAITASQLTELLNEQIEDYFSEIITDNPIAPGQFRQHYCTHTELSLFDFQTIPQIRDKKLRIAIVFIKNDSKIAGHFEKFPKTKLFWLSEDGNLRIAAKNLFSLLQKLDSSEFDVILCERPPREGIGLAIDDRLLRSAAKFIR